MKKIENLKIVYKNVVDLIPYVNNARTHSDEQINQIASSIKEFGFNNPILIDSENGVIAGHGRLLAALKLKLDKVPTVEISGLSEAQKKAYIIADNKIALNASWDMELLKLELDSIKDCSYTPDSMGFEQEELEKLLDIHVEGSVETSSEIEEKQATKTEPLQSWKLDSCVLKVGEDEDSCRIADALIDFFQKTTNKQAERLSDGMKFNEL